MHLSGFIPITRIFRDPTFQFCCFSSIRNVNNVRLYLQRARLIDSIRLCLRSGSEDSLIRLLSDRALDSFVVNSALRSAPSPDSALSLIEKLKEIPHFSHTQCTLYTLAKILAKSGQTRRLKALVDAINSGKFINVARVSFMDRMRWYAAAGDVDQVISVWGEWRSLQKTLCAESYNIMMGLYAQMSNDGEAVKVFWRMVDEGALPNSRTYTIIIEHLVSVGKCESAMQIFEMLPQMRVKRTLKQYSILVEAFARVNHLDAVKALIDEMSSDGILPGRAMRLSLQRMQGAGYVAEIGELVRDMLPDERIKKIGYSVDASDDEDEDVDCSQGEESNQPQLKPWLDPAALASALQHWEPEEVLTLEDAKLVWTTRLVCKMIRNFRSAETAWQFFCWVTYRPEFTHDIYTISRMITKLARHGRTHLVDQLLAKIREEGIKLSFSTIRLIIDFYGISKSGDAALKVFRSINTICGPISKSSLSLLYSSLLRTLTKCKMHNDTFDILEEMILFGIIPDTQTYSGLMHHFALLGDIKMVQRLFGMVRQSGIQPDAYMYKVIILAYCKGGRAALALRIFEDMRNCALIPDAVTKEMLVKSLWEECKLKEAAAVEERFEEINEVIPAALPGHVYTVTSTDLSRVYSIYSSCFPNIND